MPIHVSTTIIINRNGHILLMLRDNKPGILNPGCWGLIGGHAEKGETPLGTAAREIEEETGIHIEESDLSFLKSIETEEKIRHVFLLKGAWTDLDIVRGEGQDMKFQSIENIPSLPMSEEHQMILSEFLKHKG